MGHGETTPGGKWQYKIHYMGWAARWDEWMDNQRVYKGTAEMAALLKRVSAAGTGKYAVLPEQEHQAKLKLEQQRLAQLHAQARKRKSSRTANQTSKTVASVLRSVVKSVVVQAKHEKSVKRAIIATANQTSKTVASVLRGVVKSVVAQAKHEKRAITTDVTLLRLLRLLPSGLSAEEFRSCYQHISPSRKRNSANWWKEYQYYHQDFVEEQPGEEAATIQAATDLHETAIGYGKECSACLDTIALQARTMTGTCEKCGKGPGRMWHPKVRGQVKQSKHRGVSRKRSYSKWVAKHLLARNVSTSTCKRQRPDWERERQAIALKSAQSHGGASAVLQVLPGIWHAVGVVETGEDMEEQFILQRNPDGSISGGSLPANTDDSFEIGCVTVDPVAIAAASANAAANSVEIRFVQTYPDGATTTWAATAHWVENHSGGGGIAAGDMLCMREGRWEGACDGKFTAAQAPVAPVVMYT